MALFCTAASAATPSFDEPFHAEALSLIALHPADRTAASENPISLGHLATEQATTFAKGADPANEGRELGASKAGLSTSDQPAINDAMRPVAKHDGYALMLSGVGVISILVVRRRRLD